MGVKVEPSAIVNPKNESMSAQDFVEGHVDKDAVGRRTRIFSDPLLAEGPDDGNRTLIPKARLET